MAHRQLRQPAEHRRARPPSYDEELEGEEAELFVRYVQLPTPDEIEEGLFHIPTTPAASIDVEAVDSRIALRELEPLTAQDIRMPAAAPPEVDDVSTYTGRTPETDLEIDARLVPVPWNPGDVPFTPHMLTIELMEVGTNIARPRDYLEEVEDRIAAPRQPLEEIEAQPSRVLVGSLEAEVGLSRPADTDLEPETQSTRTPSIDLEPASHIPRSPDADPDIDAHSPRGLLEEPTVEAGLSRPPQISLEVDAAVPTIREDMVDVQTDIAPVRYTEGLPTADEFPHSRAIISDLNVDVRTDQPAAPEEFRITDEDISTYIDVNNTNYMTYQAFFDI